MNTHVTTVAKHHENIVLFFLVLSFIGLASSMYISMIEISLSSHPLLGMLLPKILLPGYAVFGILGYVAVAFTFVFMAISISEKIYGQTKTNFIKNNHKKMIGYGSVFLWMAALLIGAGNTYVEFENILSKLNIMNSGPFRPNFIASLTPAYGLWIFCLALAVLLPCVAMQTRIAAYAKKTELAKTTQATSQD